MQTLSFSDILQKKFIGVDDLRRELTTILKKLKKEKGEVVITQHGKPQAVLVDLKSYLEFEELQEQIADSDPKFVKEINAAIADVRKGNGIPADEVFKKLGI